MMISFPFASMVGIRSGHIISLNVFGGLAADTGDTAPMHWLFASALTISTPQPGWGTIAQGLPFSICPSVLDDTKADQQMRPEFRNVPDCVTIHRICLPGLNETSGFPTARWPTETSSRGSVPETGIGQILDGRYSMALDGLYRRFGGLWRRAGKSRGIKSMRNDIDRLLTQKRMPIPPLVITMISRSKSRRAI
jgi:hypothetical protein